MPPHVSKERFESLLCIIKQTHMYEALESAGTVSRACYALLNTHICMRHWKVQGELETTTVA